MAPPNRPNQENNAQNNNEENENRNQPNGEANSESEQNAVPPQPNIFRLILTVVFTFFTSMVPERPRVVN